jgi:hypothetical protein
MMTTPSRKTYPDKPRGGGEIIDKGECAGFYRRGGMFMLTRHPQLVGRV